MGGYKAISVMLGGSTYYRVIYILLTRATAWCALLYFIAGVFVNFSRSRKPEPVAEET